MACLLVLLEFLGNFDAVLAELQDVYDYELRQMDRGLHQPFFAVCRRDDEIALLFPEYQDSIKYVCCRQCDGQEKKTGDVE